MGARGPLKMVDPTRKYQTATPPKPATTLPKPPAWLSAPAKREWKRVVPELHRRGLLTELDRQVLAQYCQAVARIEECEQALADGLTYGIPGGRQYLKPEYQVLKDAQKEVRQLSTMLGLSPNARMRMELPEPAQPDELESLLD